MELLHFDWSKLRTLRRFPKEDVAAVATSKNLMALATTYSGQLLAISERGRGDVLWDDTEVPLVYDLRYSPDGRFLAVATAGSTVRVYAAGAGDLLQSWRFGRKGERLAVEFSRDGANLFVLLQGRDSKLTAFSTADWRIRGSYTASSLDHQTGIVLSDDGRLIALDAANSVLRKKRTTSGEFADFRELDPWTGVWEIRQLFQERPDVKN